MLRSKLAISLFVATLVAACGPGGELPVELPIEGQIQLTVSVLPEEGGALGVSWGASEPGVYITNGAGLNSEESPLNIQVEPQEAGTSFFWSLRHPTRKVTGERTLRVRPHWKSPSSVSWGQDSPLRHLWAWEDGSIWLHGETRESAAGSNAGGVDIWAIQHAPDGQLIGPRQWGGRNDEQWRLGIRIKDQYWGLVRTLAGNSVGWQMWQLPGGTALPREVACAKGLDDVLHAQALNDSVGGWILLGVGAASGATGGHLPSVIVRHCESLDRVIGEVSWPRIAEVSSGFIVQGSTPEAVVLGLNSRGDVGAGASGSETATMAAVDLRKKQQKHIIRVDSGATSTLAGGRMTPSRDRIDWWGEVGQTNSETSRAWLIQTAGPAIQSNLQVTYSWMSEENQKSMGKWVWASRSESMEDLPNDDSSPAVLLAIAQLGESGISRELPPGVMTQLHWLEVDGGQVQVMQEIPWLLHGLSGRTRVSAATQDASGDWLLVTESEKDGEIRFQLDRFRSNGQGRGRADLNSSHMEVEVE